MFMHVKQAVKGTIIIVDWKFPNFVHFLDWFKSLASEERRPVHSLD